MPTFLFLRDGAPVESIRGANVQALQAAAAKLAGTPDAVGSEDASAGSTADTSIPSWIGSSLPRGYNDITSEIDQQKVEVLNSDSSFGVASTVFTPLIPSGLDKGKGKDAANDAGDDPKVDWVESDTDEQLMLFVPLRSTTKIHSLHITSLVGQGSDEGAEAVFRPKTIKIYVNRSHVLDFDEADKMEPTQTVTLSPKDWDAETATAKLELRFVKFQNVSTLVIFVVDVEDEGGRVRIDRVRIIGEKGEKREMGKLQKLGGPL